MKTLKILSVFILVIMLMSFVTPYVNDRKNWTLTPDINGEDETTGLFDTRNDTQKSNAIGDETGIGGKNYRIYTKFNTTDFTNATLNFSAIESIYYQTYISRLDLWDAGDTFEIVNITTDINSSDPISGAITSFITNGTTIGTKNSVSAGTTYNISIDGITLGWQSFQYTKRFGYFSLGIRPATTVSNDEILYFNTSQGGNSPLLIVQTSCAPQTYVNATGFFGNEWVINSTCIIIDEQVNVWKNITILDSGNLVLQNVNLTFFANGSNIYIKKGGQFSMGNGSKFVDSA